ncbi:carbamoyltransferase [Halobellus salinus]|uniref:Carbamoyltransferase n=1 Tax=Halobellus salinus TaxID=931585 RepID=A0A830E982_9EURY|nr:carbamoyltransferase [Halobellus salinus]
MVFAIEEERLNRRKHAVDDFPHKSINACLNYCDISLSDVDKIVLPYVPSLESKIWLPELKRRLFSSKSTPERLRWIERYLEHRAQAHILPTSKVKSELRQIGDSLPPIDNQPHHRCHAASAFHPSGFDEALVFTVDGKGEHDSTVVWHGDEQGLERLRTYTFPNSLGHFYGAVTEYLGYRAFNGEGKIMGLAPYGELNEKIETSLRSAIETGVDYDVTSITEHGIEDGVAQLERLLGRPRNTSRGEFTDWQKDLARVTQHLLEEIVTGIIKQYVNETGIRTVTLSGGVALNCKMNKEIRELDAVNDVFVQPVSHDAGLALGAGFLESSPETVYQITDVYYGQAHNTEVIKSILETNKIDYTRPTQLTQRVAEEIANGQLVGWFQGRTELGPRALGNRSILADPRTKASRDRVNRFVKHREEWRPFAPSILADAAESYFENPAPSPFMIDTFQVRPERASEIEAVLHPADGTTRPQTVSKQQNPKYYQLISDFADITGVPVLLNTSFNDHGEPIVNTPTEALKDFFGMGLDVLVLDEYLVTKS